MSNYRVLERVSLGPNACVGEFVTIGVLPSNCEDIPETTIGADAVIRSHTVIYAGATIGEAFQTGHHVTIRENNRIGDRVSIGTGTVVEHDVEIEDNVRIHSQAFIPEFTILEEDCWVGPRVCCTNALHPLCPEVKECLRGPRVERGAIIGANVTLLPGVIIGKGAVIGAGSVVVGNVPEGKVAAGNPARVIKDVKELDCRYGLVDKPYS